MIQIETIPTTQQTIPIETIPTTPSKDNETSGENVTNDTCNSDNQGEHMYGAVDTKQAESQVNTITGVEMENIRKPTQHTNNQQEIEDEDRSEYIIINDINKITEINAALININLETDEEYKEDKDNRGNPIKHGYNP